MRFCKNIPYAPRYLLISFMNRVLRRMDTNNVVSFRDEQFSIPDEVREILEEALHLEPVASTTRGLRLQYNLVYSWAHDKSILIDGSEVWPGVMNARLDAVFEEELDAIKEYFRALAIESEQNITLCEDKV